MAIAIGLLKMLLELAGSKKNGAVDASAHGARVRIFVENGDIVYADEGGVGETLGRILVRERVLTEDQYGAAIEWTADLRARGQHARLGEVLVDLGFITREQLFAALSAQVRQKVVRALGWTGARVSFIESHGILDIAARHPTPLEPLVLAALRVAERDRVDLLFDQARSRFVALRADRIARAETLERLTSFRMHGDEDAFARGLDGASTIDELLDEPAEIDRHVVLAALLLTDCLDLHATPQAPRDKPLPKPKPPRPRRSLVPPAPSSSRPSVEPPASSKRLASIHPPARLDVERVTTRLRDARASQVGLPKSPSAATALEMPTTSRLLAEKAFQQGKRFVRANKLAFARDELRRACSLHAAAEYQLWAAWASLRCEPARADVHADELRDAAERAVAQNPELGFGYYALGHLARRAGDETRAKELFDRARTLDPDAVDVALDVRLRDTASPPSSQTRAELRPLAPPMTSRTETANADEARDRDRDRDEARTGQPQDDAKSAHEDEANEKVRSRDSGRPAHPPADSKSAHGDTANEKARSRDSGRPDRAPADSKSAHADAANEKARSRDSGRPDRASAESKSAARSREAGGGDGGEKVRDPSREATTLRPPRAAVSRATPARSRTPALVAVGAVICLAIVVARSMPQAPATAQREVVATASAPEPEPSVVAVPEPEAAIASSLSSAIDMDAAAEAAAETDASDAASEAGVAADAEPGIASNVGLLDLPKAANGHRVFVDGRVVGEPPAVVLVPCGRHVIKVGSAGRDQLVDVPCGARIAVAYP